MKRFIARLKYLIGGGISSITLGALGKVAANFPISHTGLEVLTVRNSRIWLGMWLGAFLLVFSANTICLAQTNGVTESSIVLGQSAAFKGTSAALGSELWRGADAYFQHINSQGGIHGRKIKIIAMDDGYEGNATLKNTIRLINNEKVFGLFGYVGTPTIVKALPVIQKFSKRGVFLFSNFTGAQPQREPPHDEYVFNIRSSYRQETKGLVDRFVRIGYKKFGVFIQGDAYGKSGSDGVRRGLKEHGLEILAEATYKRGTPYSSSMEKQVEVLMSAGVDVVVSIGAYEACAAFIRDMRLAGFKGPIANVSFVGAESLLELLINEEEKRKIKLTSKLVNSQVVPPWDKTSIPLVKKYQAMMDKYKPQVPDHLMDPNYKPAKYSFVSLEGFLNAVVLVDILKRSPKELTRANFVETLEKTKNLDIGLGLPINFSETRHQALDNVFFTTVKNGRYTLIENWSELK